MVNEMMKIHATLINTSSLIYVTVTYNVKYVILHAYYEYIILYDSNYIINIYIVIMKHHSKYVHRSK